MFSFGDASTEMTHCRFKKDKQFLVSDSGRNATFFELMWQTAIHNKNLLFVSRAHTHTHLHKHSKTGNRASIQTSYLTYTDTQNSLGLCVVIWNPLKTSLTFFPASPSLSFFYLFFYPGLDVVTVVCGPTGLYSTHRSCRDSWIMEIIFMPRPLSQLNEMQGPGKDAWATRSVAPDPHHLLWDTIQAVPTSTTAALCLGTRYSYLCVPDPFSSSAATCFHRSWFFYFWCPYLLLSSYISTRWSGLIVTISAFNSLCKSPQV